MLTSADTHALSASNAGIAALAIQLEARRPMVRSAADVYTPQEWVNMTIPLDQEAQRALAQARLQAQSAWRLVDRATELEGSRYRTGASIESLEAKARAADLEALKADAHADYVHRDLLYRISTLADTTDDSPSASAETIRLDAQTIGAARWRVMVNEGLGEHAFDDFLRRMGWLQAEGRGLSAENLGQLQAAVRDGFRATAIDAQLRGHDANAAIDNAAVRLRSALGQRAGFGADVLGIDQQAASVKAESAQMRELRIEEYSVMRYRWGDAAGAWDKLQAAKANLAVAEASLPPLGPVRSVGQAERNIEGREQVAELRALYEKARAQYDAKLGVYGGTDMQPLDPAGPKEVVGMLPADFDARIAALQKQEALAALKALSMNDTADPAALEAARTQLARAIDTESTTATRRDRAYAMHDLRTATTKLELAEGAYARMLEGKPWLAEFARNPSAAAHLRPQDQALLARPGGFSGLRVMPSGEHWLLFPREFGGAPVKLPEVTADLWTARRQINQAQAKIAALDAGPHESAHVAGVSYEGGFKTASAHALVSFDWADASTRVPDRALAQI